MNFNKAFSCKLQQQRRLPRYSLGAGRDFSNSPHQALYLEKCKGLLLVNPEKQTGSDVNRDSRRTKATGAWPLGILPAVPLALLYSRIGIGIEGKLGENHVVVGVVVVNERLSLGVAALTASRARVSFWIVTWLTIARLSEKEPFQSSAMIFDATALCARKKAQG